MNVSIVIPNYNGERYILDCIASVYDQIEDKREIIIVDNHSTDNSVSLIEQHYPDVTLIINDENRGFAAAVNQGIRASSGKYVILLNNDAFAREGFVEALYKCMESDPKIFSASAKMLRYSDPNTIDDAGDNFTLLGWAYKIGDGKPSECFHKQKLVFSSCGGAAIYRRSELEQLGYFDASFFAYLEDVDLGFRANIFGYKNVLCPYAETLHIGSATTGSKYNEFKVKISARNHIYLIYKNYPFIMLLFNLPFLVLGILIKGVFFFVRGYGLPYIIGIAQGIRNIHLVTRVRHKPKYILNYLRIQAMLIRSMFEYIFEKLELYLKRSKPKR